MPKLCAHLDLAVEVLPGLGGRPWPEGLDAHQGPAPWQLPTKFSLVDLPESPVAELLLEPEAGHRKLSGPEATVPVGASVGAVGNRGGDQGVHLHF